MSALTLQASMQQFDTLQTYLTTAAESASLSNASLLRARLVLEELFTNTVSHGYASHRARVSEVDEPCIWLEFQPMATGLSVRYRDAGVPYNPVQRAEDSANELEIQASMEARSLGGLGCLLIQRMSDAISYRYEAGCNVIELLFKNREFE